MKMRRKSSAVLMAQRKPRKQIQKQICREEGIQVTLTLTPVMLRSPQSLHSSPKTQNSSRRAIPSAFLMKKT
ncbi:hypothetical protein M9458_034870, partial [Cirrhinus mrigala]